ncbi:RNA ligase RtcB family protein [Thorsellia anophelis]|uniref:3'-phosphate/5'-hydroxy nucleic acid ligase n=1 Tax=Thorsellia anophelis DSM 18579 TaxID=1123402 RepID=A0A1H9YUX6_9GAMM|nr:RNA ligase RtcB family protein [Thorsellia anophelis]SES72948.1 release factor H-coupled RctB family protein [Thorsellia anophelis DSM 18579]
MNTYLSGAVRAIQSNVAIIANQSTWIDETSVDQLVQCASLPNMQKVIGMPDLHPGRTYPIGAAFLTHDYVYPALIGNDIGCGMGIWQTDILTHKFKLSKALNHLSNLESALSETDILEYCTTDDISNQLFQLLKSQNITYYGLGTIGRGNHFVEIQKIETVYREDLMNHYGLSKQNIQLLVHSGSRGVGDAILNTHLAKYGYNGMPCESEDALSYLKQHDNALIFATLNRRLIANRFASRLRAHISPILDLCHNFVEYNQSNQGYIHRKGASPSDKDIAVIPGSRGDFSYIVRTNENNHLLNSIAHGAGRKWRRSHCRANLRNLYQFDELFKTKLGSHVICHDRNLMYEEAPEAYKAVIPIIDSLVEAGLIEVIAKLKPLITFKTNGECC